MNYKFLSFTKMTQKHQEFNQKGIRPPYFFKINKDDQYLFFTGSKHSNNPKDKQNEQ